jgi:hypothetical protein
MWPKPTAASRRAASKASSSCAQTSRRDRVPEDAFDLGGMQRIDLAHALVLVLLADLRGKGEQRHEGRLQISIAVVAPWRELAPAVF